MSSNSNSKAWPSIEPARFAMLSFVATFVFVVSPNYSNIFFGQSVLEPSLPLHTVLALLLLMGALIVALYRRDQIIGLQKELLDEQQRDLDLSARALAAHAIFTETDRSGNITEVNDKFVETFGYPREEVVGKNAAHLYEGRFSDPSYLAVKECLCEGIPWNGEQKLRRKDGSLVIVQTSAVPLFNKDGVHLKNITIRTDVTDVRKSESEAYHTALLRKLRDEVFIYDASSLRILYMNETALNRFGWSLDDAKSRLISDTDPNFDIAAFRAHIEPLRKGRLPIATIIAKQGDSYVEIQTQMHVGVDEEPVFVSILRDVTERKNAEMKRLQTVSTVSHELRTPLTSIMGALKLFRAKYAAPNDKSSSLLNIAERNSERMLLVLNDILDLEKFQAGKMNLEKTKTDLVALVSEAVTANDGYARQYGVEFVFDAPARPAMVFADHNRLIQVMANLLSNAAKFSNSGDQIRLRIVDLNNSWRVEVSDSGPGIPEQHRGTVFESFGQVVDPSRPKVGTGLGLSISRNIIKLHHGEIDFRNHAGPGTTFYFDLPKLRPQPADGYETFQHSTAAE